MITFDYIYKVLQEETTRGWTSGRTVNRSCFDLKNQAVSDAIHKGTGVHVEAQFWMSKKRKNLNFEFATGKKEHTQLRERFAASLRAFILAKDPPDWLKASRGSTVCKVQILDKTDEVAKKIIKDYFRFIDKAIREWSQVTLAELLPHKGALEAVSKGESKDAIDDLNELPPGVSEPEKTYRMSASYARDPKVRTYVIARAKGVCEYCGEQGFLMFDGKSHYVEAHHIIALADDGKDTPENVIALCSRHHREAHYGRNRAELEKEMSRLLKS
jgi:hypothetical protein